MSKFKNLIQRARAAFTPRRRAYYYRGALVATPVLVAGGVVTAGQAADALKVLAAVLAVSTAGLATAHTSTKGA